VAVVFSSINPGGWEPWRETEKPQTGKSHQVLVQTLSDAPVGRSLAPMCPFPPTRTEPAISQYQEHTMLSQALGAGLWPSLLNPEHCPQPGAFFPAQLVPYASTGALTSWPCSVPQVELEHPEFSQAQPFHSHLGTRMLAEHSHNKGEGASGTHGLDCVVQLSKGQVNIEEGLGLVPLLTNHQQRRNNHGRIQPQACVR
jgi:hypothetical protein